MKRKNFTSHSPWEDTVGYSRAVLVGNTLEVSGTTAVKDKKIIGKGDYYIQSKYILEKISVILEEAGFSMTDVVRTRIFVCDISKWEDVGKAHAEFFKNTKPASTMVEVSRLIDPELLVEIEITAIIAP
jgi:enamine deaminase RidA (YjgF/YER057c/UK114 family)